MSTLRYTEEHEWIRVDGDTATIGISPYAQEQLGDVVFVDLPQPGKKVEKGKEVAVVESVKAASEVYAPVSGEVVAVNGDLSTEPAKVNSDPLGAGWFVKMKLANKAELDGLMDQAAYDAYVKGLH
ncbi:MAG TPA: glycine cleavage system protein GcvH [Hypericibacter adhaerens]|uniref:glycine cleavage system protein GcvH n=1 Tax=Hypericibacter adhaerens TaxID=2602016 RepID=UPI002C2E1B2D|nr:glycine cleavage system protein GcvH [Hypericibacter adhaerens]HWA44568.1 glycine cleavage system protein GcvH [Hypericibacter adhaerens]